MTQTRQNSEVPGAEQSPEFVSETAKTLIIACGALAREILDIIRLNGLEDHLGVTCLPAKLHNEPQKIPERLREKIREAKVTGSFDRIYVAYADCGTGGILDRVVREEGAERIGGPHCYSFYAGSEAFDRMAEEELGTFYLTDYMVRQFDALIMEGMGLNKYPQMRELMFANYTRAVYLAQVDDPALEEKAKAAADKLGLRYEKRFTGYGELADFVEKAAADRDGSER